MIVTTDLHLTDRERDEYRWDFLRWLTAKTSKSSEDTWILGDLTDAKDGHSSVLVNRIVRALVGLAACGGQVYVLKGNHDYTDEAEPFFGFVDKIPGVHFVTEPQWIETDVGLVLALPHTRQPVPVWDPILEERESDPDLILCHQTFNGANAGGGFKLQAGISSTYFKEWKLECPVLSGDIHVPQTLGGIEYVGTPYPVAFGDDHDCRVLGLWNEGDGVEWASEPVETIQKLKLVIDDLDDLEGIGPGDQVKVKLRLPRREFADWEQRRDEVVELVAHMGGHLHSIELEERKRKRRLVDAPRTSIARDTRTPRELLAQFCEARGLTEGERFAGEDVLDQLEA